MSKSKHNYTQYSKKHDGDTGVLAANAVDAAPVVTVTEVTETPVVEDTLTENQVAIEEVVAPVVTPVVETVETVTLPETVTGQVVGCTKLNVRAKPEATADVVCVVDAATEMVINVTKSNKDWLSITTATGVEGYCMRKFVNANL